MNIEEYQIYENKLKCGRLHSRSRLVHLERNTLEMKTTYFLELVILIYTRKYISEEFPLIRLTFMA